MEGRDTTTKHSTERRGNEKKRRIRNMRYYRSIARSARLLCQSGLSMLLLLALAACGAAEQRAEVPAAATAPESTAAARNDGVAVATVSASPALQGATDQ